MDHELDLALDLDLALGLGSDASPVIRSEEDWVEVEVDLDDCDGYVVVAIDPQTGEVDAHGPYAGLGALHAAEDMRATFAREQLDDVVVRIVRWHTAAGAGGGAVRHAA